MSIGGYTFALNHGNHLRGQHMKKNFLSRNKSLPQLNYDMVLLESTHPILFTCIDDDNNLYICSCHCANADKQEWIIVPTSPENVIELLTDKITIREIFEISGKDIYIATERDNHSAMSVKQVPISKVNEDILPSAGYYMEADPGEFDAEIRELKSRTGWLEQSAQELNI